MEDIIFYDSNRVPVMSWHEIKRENKNIFFKIEIKRTIFASKSEGYINDTVLLSLINNLDDMYTGNKNIISEYRQIVYMKEFKKQSIHSNIKYRRKKL